MEGLGGGWGQPVERDGAGASDTCFAVTGYVGDGSSRDCCIISFLKSNPLSTMRPHFASTGSQARYLLFMPGYWSRYRLAMEKRWIIWYTKTPFRR